LRFLCFLFILKLFGGGAGGSLFLEKGSLGISGETRLRGSAPLPVRGTMWALPTPASLFEKRLDPKTFIKTKSTGTAGLQFLCFLFVFKLFGGGAGGSLFLEKGSLGISGETHLRGQPTRGTMWGQPHTPSGDFLKKVP